MSTIAAMNTNCPTLAAMPGLWRRSLIERADGSRDITTRVYWLQGPTLYVDLRQPASLPDQAPVGSLQGLSQQDCLALAQQQGFAGRLQFDGDCFEWQRQIDYQPASAAADAGWLYWESQVLVERGRDEYYIEHWHRDAALAAAPLCAMTLHGVEQPDAILLRVGPTFMFARARTTTAPFGKTLAECVAGAGSVQSARALVDCEISLGRIGAGRCVIQASTLPWRVGCDLAVRVSGATLTTGDTGPDASPRTRHWDIAQAEGDPATDWVMA